MEMRPGSRGLMHFFKMREDLSNLHYPVGRKINMADGENPIG